MNWYRFQARDTHILYGCGTAEEAHLYKEELNMGRERTDRYSSIELTDQEVKALRRDTAFNPPRPFILADALKDKDTLRERGYPNRQQRRPQTGSTLSPRSNADVEQPRRAISDYFRLARSKVA
jgi:hypothetical protein